MPAAVSLPDIADQAQRTYGFEQGEQAVAVLSRVLIDKTGATKFAADDLPTSLANLLASAGSIAAIAANQDIVTPITPVTTDVVTATATGASETMYLTPAGTLAALTYTFPTNANSRIGQVLRLVSTAVVTALTVSSSGLTLQGTAVTALAVNTPITWKKVAASTWMRL